MQNYYIYMMYHASGQAVFQYFQVTTVCSSKLQVCAKLADAFSFFGLKSASIPQLTACSDRMSLYLFF